MAPDTADVPSKPAVLYALCGALARKASAQTADRLFRYANRLPAEFSTLLMLDSVHACPAVQRTRGFIDWQVSHSDIMV